MVRRLADEYAARTGASELPVAAVGDVTRVVPVAPVTAVLFPRPGGRPELESAEGGAVELPVVCPDELAGRPVRLSVANVPGKVREEVMRCPEVGAQWLLHLADLKPGQKMTAVAFLRGMPEARITAAVKDPRPTTTLRVALGIAETGAVERFVPAHFRVVAQPEGGRPTTLIERTLDPAHRPSDRGWIEEELALGPAHVSGAGDLRLSFEGEPAGDQEVPAFPVWGDPTIVEPSPGGRPNVVLISLDTLRADQLGCYGNHRATSPAIDRLASQGTLFESVIAQAPWTLPSHVTMLSGLYSCVHGVTSGGLGHHLPVGIHPLAEVLRREGYTTAAFTEDAYLEAGVFARGFGLYRANANNDQYKVEDTVASALTWLRARAREPFFLFVHTYQTHAPYFSRPAHDGEHPALAAYNAAIRFVDHTLAGLFDALDGLGLGERTILVVTSDHGEAFDEHGHSGHGKSLYEEELRVPLVWRAPGLVAPGRRVGGLVGLLDVAPTILDLLGVEVPSTFQGRSLAAALRPGKGEPRLPDRLLFSENSIHEVQVAVRAASWKVFFEDGQPMRGFSLDVDPDERHPVGDGPLVETAERERARFSAECERVRAAVGVALPATPPSTAGPPDPEHERRLRALGYLD